MSFTYEVNLICDGGGDCEPAILTSALRTSPEEAKAALIKLARERGWANVHQLDPITTVNRGGLWLCPDCRFERDQAERDNRVAEECTRKLRAACDAAIKFLADNLPYSALLVLRDALAAESSTAKAQEKKNL